MSSLLAFTISIHFLVFLFATLSKFSGIEQYNLKLKTLEKEGEKNLFSWREKIFLNLLNSYSDSKSVFLRFILVIIKSFIKWEVFNKRRFLSQVSTAYVTQVLENSFSEYDLFNAYRKGKTNQSFHSIMSLALKLPVILINSPD